MIAHTELESFEDLVPIIKNIANSGNERFFRMDVKPDYGDTPENLRHQDLRIKTSHHMPQPPTPTIHLPVQD
jgi:hypothetical protein